MHTQIVMDRTGDTRHDFDPTDEPRVKEARDRFAELTRQGFTAAKRTESGACAIIKTFDPAVAETLFIPRLVGG
jgi:hypothetical protein